MAALPDGTMVLRLRQEGRDQIAVLDPTSGGLRRLEQPWVQISALTASGDTIVLIGATDDHPSAVATVALGGGSEWLHRPTQAPLDRRSVSVATPVRFPTRAGVDAQMLVYRPTSRLVAGPSDSRPPLLVLCHGGPIADPGDAQYLLDRVPGVDGFYGASSMERLPTEIAIARQVTEFVGLSLKRNP
jgi:dipeptidyl aminopeptidase/acylaminoacyl peptidase